jgi:hypothetical protein
MSTDTKKDAPPAEEPKKKEAAPESTDTKKDAPPAEEPKKFGVPVSEFEKLSLREQKLLEMEDIKSPLRNQETKEDIRDHQLLTNAPAETIAAMTGFSLKELAARAKELGTTLKGSLAGDFRPPSE